MLLINRRLRHSRDPGHVVQDNDHGVALPEDEASVSSPVPSNSSRRSHHLLLSEFSLRPTQDRYTRVPQRFTVISIDLSDRAVRFGAPTGLGHSKASRILQLASLPCRPWLGTSAIVLGGSLALAASLLPVAFGLSFLIPLLYAASSGVCNAAGNETASDGWRDFSYVALFGIIWASLSVVLNRPDPDEEVYIGLMVSYLSDPFVPINTLPDFQFGVFTARYAISSFDPLRAVISYITGHRLLSVYFI